MARQQLEPPIGFKRQDGKIWSGPDFGYQSPATHKKLLTSGAFKHGAQRIRRLSSTASQLYDRHAPQALKDAVRWYGQSDQREQQRLKDRGFTQEQIDGANAFKEKHSKDSGNATDRLIQQVSDATNVAPEIIQAAAFVAEGAAEGFAGRAMARRTLRGVSRAPAPAAHALTPEQGRRQARALMRGDNPNIVRKKPDQKQLSLDVDPKFDGPSSPTTQPRPGDVFIERDGKIISAHENVPVSQQALRDARRIARDPEAAAKAQAAIDATRNKGPRNTSPTQSPKVAEEWEGRHAISGSSQVRTDARQARLDNAPSRVGGRPQRRNNQTELALGVSRRNTGNEIRDVRRQLRETGRDVRGQEIAPSYVNSDADITFATGNDGRIIYQGGSANVHQDPHTLRMRGKDLTDGVTKKDLLREVDGEIEAKHKGGYGKSKKKATIGSPGASARSAPQSWRQTINDDFISSNPHRRARSAQRAGTRRRRNTAPKGPSEQVINQRLNNKIADLNAERVSRSAVRDSKPPQSRVEPGARFTNEVARLDEGGKRAGHIAPHTQRGSAPKEPVKAQDHRETVTLQSGDRKRWRTARGGQVRKRGDRSDVRADTQARRRRAASRKRYEGPDDNATITSVDQNGNPTRLDQQVKEEMRGLKHSDPRRDHLTHLRDPALDAHMQRQVQRIRNTPNPTVSTLDQRRLARRNGIRTNQHNIKVGTDTKKRLAPNQKGAKGTNNPPMRRLDRKTGEVIERDRVVPTRQRTGDRRPSVARKNVQSAAYAEGIRELKSQVRLLPEAQRPAALRAIRGKSLKDARALVKSQLEALDIDTRTRSGGLNQSDRPLIERTRAANAQTRLDARNARRPSIKGVPLPEERVQHGRIEMPNNTKGTATEVQFTRNGELKGTSTKGKVKGKQTRSKDQEKAAKELMAKRQERLRRRQGR